MRADLMSLIRLFERYASLIQIVIAGGSIVSMAVVEVLNAIGREFGYPFPDTLETAEALMISTVFMAIGYAALKEEHTQVTITTRKLSLRTTRLIDASAYLFAAVVFGMLTYGAWPLAWKSIAMQEIRIGVYNFPVWIFRTIFVLGLMLMTIQSMINAVKFWHQAFHPGWMAENDLSEKHAA